MESLVGASSSPNTPRPRVRYIDFGGDLELRVDLHLGRVTIDNAPVAEPLERQELDGLIRLLKANGSKLTHREYLPKSRSFDLKNRALSCLSETNRKLEGKLSGFVEVVHETVEIEGGLIFRGPIRFSGDSTLFGSSGDIGKAGMGIGLSYMRSTLRNRAASIRSVLDSLYRLGAAHQSFLFLLLFGGFFWLVLSWHRIAAVGAVALSVTLMVLLYWAFGRVAAFAPSKTLKELWLVYKSPPHYVLSAWAAVLFLYVITRTFRDIQTVIAVLGAGIAVLLLLFSIFLKQNRTLLREIILRHFQDMIDRSNKFCCAIKFDIDLIVAINDYSYATGNEIVHLVHHTLLSHQKELAQRGIEVLSVELPESDEVIWLLPKRSTQEAADIADVIRREVKSALPQVQYYNEACEFVVRKLTNPPLTGEEQQGIGTLSAGVAAHTRGAESLLTDISAAIKEAKFRGRNRTVIYQREHPSIVRDH